MKELWRNLKMVRYEMKRLNKKDFMVVSKKVKQLRSNIMKKQSQIKIAPIS